MTSSGSGLGGIADPKARVIVVGVGNTFYGDDGVGYCIAEALKKCSSLAPHVYSFQTLNPGHSMLLEGYSHVVFIDAYYDPEAPPDADIVVLELDPSRLSELDAVMVIESIEPHSLDPLKLLVIARAAGVFNGKGYLIGIRPERIEFNKPLTLETIKRGLKAVNRLREILAELGISMEIDVDCVTGFLEEKCKGPVLD